MYYLLHRQKVPDKVTRMPDGLSELMSDISREVLREQPNSHCLYKFIADYLDALIRVREKTAVVQSVINDLIQNTECVSNFLQNAGICFEKADQSSRIIQAAFHEYMKSKQGPKSEEMKQFNELELLSELVTKCKFTQFELARAKPAIRKAYRQFINDYLSLMKATVYGASSTIPITEFAVAHYLIDGPKLEGLHRAATIIQAYFRGYQTRQSMRRVSLELEILITKVLRRTDIGKRIKRTAPFQPLKYECIKDKMLLCELHKAAEIIQRSFRRWYYKIPYHYNSSMSVLDVAATKIQAYYKGYRSRKSFEKLRSSWSFARRYSSISDPCEAQVFRNSATKIQAVYRGHRIRKQMKQQRDYNIAKMYAKMDKVTLEKIENAAQIIQRAYRRYKNKNLRKFDFADIVIKAATAKIQALFRGHIARKKYKMMKEEKRKAQFKEMYAEMDEDTFAKVIKSVTIIQRAYRRYKDPFKHRVIFADVVMQVATKKLQALFRGYIARKRYKKMKEEKNKEKADIINSPTPVEDKTEEEKDRAPKVEEASQPVQETPPRPPPEEPTQEPPPPEEPDHEPGTVEEPPPAKPDAAMGPEVPKEENTEVTQNAEATDLTEPEAAEVTEVVEVVETPAAADTPKADAAETTEVPA